MSNFQEKLQKGMFEGPIMPIIIKIGIPILIGHLLNYAYLIINTYFISLINPTSSAPLSGTGLLFPLFFVFEAIASGLAVGLSTTTGRLIGEKRFNHYQNLGVTGVVIALLLTVPFMIMCYAFGPQIINLLSGDKLSLEATVYSLQFLYSLAPGLLFIILLQVYGGILIGEGLTYVTAISFMIMVTLNIVLDPILIFVLDMGVAGAGLATTISLFMAFIYLIRFIHKGKSRIPLTFNFSHFNGKIAREIIRIGLPQFLMTASTYIIIVAYNKMITNTFDENAMNAWTLVGRIDQILVIPMIAIAGAMTVIISQNYGRNQLDRIKEAFNLSLRAIMILCSIIAAVYVLLSPWLFSIFTSIPEVINLASKQVLIVSFTFCFMAISWIIASFFQATGKPLPAVIILYIRMIMIFSIGLYLVFVQKMGMNGIFISMALGNLLSCLLSFLWVKKSLKSLKFKSILE
ncbi:MATE family efflux transporter [Frischella sp. Ac48]|uniref:MATE family efflux transporter n=1 Tax=Frischella sp. Ac48 TaxID=2804531 RepID=UPI001C7CEDE8|nr:MATE family efflux transporter [Frischella sp. Ac48]MBX4132138.1 MATE family efflux transporter [Frischella sp. Ac48]